MSLDHPHPAAARQPALFIPHGAGPCFFMDWNPKDAWDRTAASARHPGQSAGGAEGDSVDIGHWLAPAGHAGRDRAAML